LAQPSQILLTLKQCEKDYLSYAKISVIYILCYSLFAVLAYLLEIKSWQGFAAIFLIAHALQTLIISFVNASSIKVLCKSNTTSFARYKKHFNTLIGNSVFGWARVNIDKYLIMTFLGSIVLATYSLGFQLGAVIGLLNTILIKVLNPIVFSSFKNGNFASTRKTIIKAVFAFLTLTASFALILPYIVPIFFGEEYSSAIHIAQLICVGYFLQVCVSIVGAVLFYEKKNKLISVLSFVSFCFLVLSLAGLLFVDKFNATNTAIMFVLSWLFHFLATLFFSIKEQRFKQLVLDD
jgi:O-antigen/teichoic acid export membrane protein